MSTVIKVFEDGCTVCETMSRFDRSVFEGFPDCKVVELPFEDVQNYEGDRFKQKVYGLLEAHAVSPTYEIEFPTYLFLNEKGGYLGVLQGALELRDFREGVKGILDCPSE